MILTGDSVGKEGGWKREMEQFRSHQYKQEQQPGLGVQKLCRKMQPLAPSKNCLWHESIFNIDPEGILLTDAG